MGITINAAFDFIKQCNNRVFRHIWSRQIHGHNVHAGAVLKPWRNIENGAVSLDQRCLPERVQHIVSC
ncbi:hypothetical protein F0726_02811 [Acidithiobacillus caldus]|nr:hypothetical protein F0726_02811 [Acidithiobacillus caldus]